MTLVVGATGLLGSAICRRLRQRGARVRGLVRPGSPKGALLSELGVEVVHGDLKEPNSLLAACRGVRNVITTATSTASRRPGDRLRRVDRNGQLDLLAAACQAGVKRYVYISLSPNLSDSSPLVRYKREVEQAVRESGLAWTVLQPSAFMDVWFGPALGWDLASGRVRVFGSGEAPVSYISLADVAEFAVLALDRPQAEGRRIPLGGPEPITPLAAIRLFEETLGRPFKVQHVPVKVIRAISLLLRSLDPIRSSLMTLGAEVARGDVIDMQQTLREYPVSLTSVRDFAQKAAEVLPKWSSS